MPSVDRRHALLLLLPFVERAREAVFDAASVLFPVSCSGCGAPDRALCRACRRALDPRPAIVHDVDAPMPIVAALPYSGAVRAVVLAYKDHGRTDAGAALGGALRAAVLEALAVSRRSGAPGRVVLVTIPSTRAAFRRRGYHPTALLLRRARLPAARRLRLSRRPADQAGLSAAERARNRSGTFVAPRRLAGRDCIVVDDIVTSGATVREAARAIEAVNGTVIGVAAVAHTVLRRTRSRSQAEPSDHSANRSASPVHIRARRHYGGRKGVDDPPFVIRASDTSDQGGRNGHQHHRTKPGHH